MSVRHGPTSDAALELILVLAMRNGLTIYDPQTDTLTRPPARQ